MNPSSIKHPQSFKAIALRIFLTAVKQILLFIIVMVVVGVAAHFWS